METSGYIAVAALLLSMALTWKSLFNGKNGIYAKSTDMDKIIDRVVELEQQVEDLKILRADMDKLAAKVAYDIQVRLSAIEREIFRQEMLDDLERKRLSRKEPI
jgi:hypothetical protein